MDGFAVADASVEIGTPVECLSVRMGLVVPWVSDVSGGVAVIGGLPDREPPLRR